MDWKYLLSYGNDMLRGRFLRFDKEFVVVDASPKGNFKGKRKDLIIDRPPRKELLLPNYEVMMPLDHAFDKEGNFQSYCRPSKRITEDYFIKATVINSHGDSYLVKAVYVCK